MKTPHTSSKVEYINMVFLQHKTATRPSHSLYVTTPEFHTTAKQSLTMYVCIHVN